MRRTFGLAALRIAAGLAAAAALTSTGAPLAQSLRTLTLQVSEQAGIRRTEYPAGARLELPPSTIPDLDRVRLRLDDADVAAQYEIASRWDDGSVRGLDVHFNVSIGPGETRAYQLDYGPGVNRPASVPRGLTLVEDADGIQIGNVRFSKDGAPLIASANYRGEFIGAGANGVFLIDASGARHELAAAQGLSIEIVRRGPLLAVLRYSGRMPIGGGPGVPFTVTCEMPNSKSWVKTTTTVEDPSRRVKSVAFETPLAFGDKPWTWDFGTDSGTYGVFRNPTDAARLTQTVSAEGNRWVIETGPAGALRPYESSLGARVKTVRGWGHLLDASRAVAFAVDAFAAEPGAYAITLNGQGQSVFAFTPAQPASPLRLVVYQHFVSTPVAIGAATNPTAMLSPLVVSVK